MKPVSNSVISQQLAWRYATKKFDPTKKISAEDWGTLEESLRASPSSFGLQPWKFIVVQDAALRKEIRAVAWDQTQITDASHLVVLAAKANPGKSDIDKLITAIAQERKIPVESLAGYRGMMEGMLVPPAPGFDTTAWASRQVYIALGFLLSTAAMLGIDACPMEGFDPAEVNRILDLEKDGYRAVVVATLGYRAADDPYATAPKVRYTREDLFSVR